MRKLLNSVLVIGVLILSTLSAQSHFTLDQYRQFLETNTNLATTDLLRQFPLSTYYKGFSPWFDGITYLYLDSVTQKYNLTEAEQNLLKQNQFVVTERLSFNSFAEAFYSIYRNDLPVMVTTDAILHALHRSYDQVLIDIEKAYLKPNLRTILQNMYANYGLLVNKYGAEPALQICLQDVDLFVTIAYSLLNGTLTTPQYASQEKVNEVWSAIQSEKYEVMPLFSETPRKLDFSQFTVRGHYDNDDLRDYFKSMMWLGRMDFLLTMPPDPVSEADLRRMNVDAFIMNELLDLSSSRSTLEANDRIIELFVGESDNLTPREYQTVMADMALTSAVQLLDSLKYAEYLTRLQSYPGSEQRILSDIFIMNPLSGAPDELPLSFRLLGQRFIIDSYIFSNVVYDRIIYNNSKIWRPLPDPLDAMFALGNDNAGYLLTNELDAFHYATQLNALRYLVDAYDDEFWSKSLYNAWLNAIRELNPEFETQATKPFFMQTAAWQHAKLNTQLASWAQLRHDNLLYAKQSYTGGAICSYPHSFVEPYPEFYRKIAVFAQKAQSVLTEVTPFPEALYYFRNLDSLMSILATLADKELQGGIDENEIAFLKSMLFKGGGMCGAPPFDGWYVSLFYKLDESVDIINGDYIVADVHTQPTDQFGGVVGRVLHVGTGNINLGVFLAYQPSGDFATMAFVGPVMSYYEKITDDFDRLTDARWSDIIDSPGRPARPDWVNIYLADKDGNALAAGRELPSQAFVGIKPKNQSRIPDHFALLSNYPNPFNARTIIRYELPIAVPVTIRIMDLTGQVVAELENSTKLAGYHQVVWNARTFPSGTYLCRIQAGEWSQTRKLLLLK